MAFDPTKVNLGADLLTSQTASARDPWQEAFRRFSTVPAAKVIQAAEVVGKITGSWMAQTTFDPILYDDYSVPESKIPVSVDIKVSALGRPGMSEIDFVPYCYGTNRFGSKGGALIGHPISFSIVGPTAKQGNRMTWQWRVDDSGDHDILYIDQPAETDVSDPLHLVGSKGSTVPNRYGIDPLTFDQRFDGGLYLIVTETGKDSVLTGGITQGGLGDGAISNPPPDIREGLGGGGVGSKFEVFRITGVYQDPNPPNDYLGFHLDPGKRLSSSFSFPAAPKIPIIKSIMLFEPVATRLLAIPDSGDGKGREQVFAVLPPARALAGEHQPIYSGVGTGYPGYTDVNFCEPGWDPTVFQAAVAGDDFTYNYMPQLPEVLASDSVGGGFLLDTTGNHGPGTLRFAGNDKDVQVGTILRVFGVKIDGAAQLQAQPNPVRRADLESLYGTYEVIEVHSAPDYTVVRRIPEVDPQTGIAFLGNTPHFLVTGGGSIALSFTIHNRIRSLWSSSYFNPDRVEASKLSNLIDPRWVGHFLETEGSTPFRADHAIFDTSTTAAGHANPGNFAELGFRMVLFPAKLKTVPTFNGPDEEILAPDFDRPIFSNEVLIDPSKPNEKQFVEVDYANGLVRLSHAPQKKILGENGAGDLAPKDDIFTAADNPRGEMVLFASCIPYTMEEGQTGSAIRLTADVTEDNPCSEFDETIDQNKEQADVYGNRVFFNISTDPAQTLTCYGELSTQSLTLTGLIADQLPRSGFFEIFQGGVPVLSPNPGTLRASLFGYYGITEDVVTETTTLHGIYGGRDHTAPDTVTIDSANPAQIVLRRIVLTPCQRNGVAGIPYQGDVFYGKSKRVETVRFDGADLQPNLDGSVTVKIRDAAARGCQENLGDLFSSWVLSGGVITAAAPPIYYVFWTDCTIIYQGVRKTVPAGNLDISGALPGPFDIYIYIDGSDCSVGYAFDLPLPNYELILLAKVSFDGVMTTSVIDLRYPLLDVNRRMDIFVGRYPDLAPEPLYAPFFDNLADAVAYANEIQNPASGFPDFKVRIRVVGPTTEDDSKLPITIKTDGLVIEGELDTWGKEPGIRWTGDSTALIDINGHDNLTFRYLTSNNQSAVTSNKDPLRATFTNSGGVSRFLTIDHCQEIGTAQGFLAMPSYHIEDAIITNNYASQVLDFGIFIATDPVTPLEWTTTDTITVTVTDGYLDFIRGDGSSLRMEAGSPAGTLALDFTAPPPPNPNYKKCIITNALLETMTMDASGAAPSDVASVRVEIHGSGDFTGSAGTITFDEGDAGLLFLNGTDIEFRIWITSRVLERSIIENNTFIQSPLRGAMSDVGAGPVEDPTGLTMVQGLGTTLIRNEAGDTITLGPGATATVTRPAANTLRITPAVGLPIDVTPIAFAAFEVDPTVVGASLTMTFGLDQYVYQQGDFGYFKVRTSAAFVGGFEFGWSGGPNGTNGSPTVGGIVLYNYFGSGTDFFSLVGWQVLFESMVINKNNRINHNHIDGFHVGIWANCIWMSEVNDNEVLNSANVGAIVGPYAGSNKVNENQIENACKGLPWGGESIEYPGNLDNNVPPGPGPWNFSDCILYGLILGGLTSQAEANNVSTGQSQRVLPGVPPSLGYLCTIYDIYLIGAWLSANENTTAWCIGGWGYALGARSNVVLSATISFVPPPEIVNAGSSILYQAFYSSIVGNSCSGGITLQNSHYSTIRGNITSTGIYTSNNAPGQTPLGSQECLIDGNVIASAVPFLGGLWVWGSAGFESHGCRISNNRLLGVVGPLGLGLADIRVSDNTERTRISHNECAQNVNFGTGCSDSHVSSNNVVGNVTVEGTCTVMGNRVGSLIVDNAPYSVVYGNYTVPHADYGIYIQGDECTITGNISGYLKVLGAYSSVTGNRMGRFSAVTDFSAGYLFIQNDGAEISGNVLDSIVETMSSAAIPIDTGTISVLGTDTVTIPGAPAIVVTSTTPASINMGAGMFTRITSFDTLTNVDIMPGTSLLLTGTGTFYIQKNALNPIAFREKTFINCTGGIPVTCDFGYGLINLLGDTNDAVITGNRFGRIMSNDGSDGAVGTVILVANRIQDALLGEFSLPPAAPGGNRDHNLA